MLEPTFDPLTSNVPDMLPVVLVWQSGQSGIGALVVAGAAVAETFCEALTLADAAGGKLGGSVAAVVGAAASAATLDGDAELLAAGTSCGRIAAATKNPPQASTSTPATTASTISQVRFPTVNPHGHWTRIGSVHRVSR